MTWWPLSDEGGGTVFLFINQTVRRLKTDPVTAHRGAQKCSTSYDQVETSRSPPWQGGPSGGFSRWRSLQGGQRVYVRVDYSRFFCWKRKRVGVGWEWDFFYIDFQNFCIIKIYSRWDWVGLGGTLQKSPPLPLTLCNLLSGWNPEIAFVFLIGEPKTLQSLSIWAAKLSHCN